MPGDKGIPMVEKGEMEPIEIEQAIQRRFAVLEDEFDFNKLSEDLQERWYYVEMEVATGKDRKAALDNLDRFIKGLDKLFPEKAEGKE